MRIPESRARIALSLATPPSMLLIAWSLWIVGAPGVVTLGLLLLSFFLGYLVLFDFPTAIDVDESGIHRISLLRRDSLQWNEVSAIVQPRKRGIIAITNDRKRRVLIDRRLAEAELELLRDHAERENVRVEL